jgi:glycosyltransferase involved in cell wall biosynthesis
MKILYLLPTVSHPTMRGELRHYHFFRSLARRHDITVMALSRTPVTTDAICDLRSAARRVMVTEAAAAEAAHTGDGNSAGVRALRGRLARRQRVQRSIGAMRAQLRELVQSEGFDVALVYSVELQPLVDELGPLPFVADLCDAQSVRIRQSLKFANPVEGAWRVASWWRMRQAERSLAGRASQVTFISGRDLAAVPQAAGRAHVIPNGLDAEYWTRSTSASSDHHLVFTGVMDYAPNDDAGKYLTTQILPRVQAVFPSVRLTIAGRNPTTELKRLAGASGAVDVTGYVPDLRPYLQKAAVFVAPLRFASGTQNKILEAMAMELPVITSSVAAEGLRVSGAAPPRVVVADRPDAFADGVINLLRDAAKRRELGALGRGYVRRHFDWERSASQLEACCVAASSESGARGRA